MSMKITLIRHVSLLFSHDFYKPANTLNVYVTQVYAVNTLNVYVMQVYAVNTFNVYMTKRLTK